MPFYFRECTQNSDRTSLDNEAVRLYKIAGMATALQIFDALEEITADLEPGSEYKVNSLHRDELFKLTEGDLLARHISKNRAQEIVRGIWNQDLEPLFRSLGIKLSFCEDAPPLLKN